MTIRERPPDNRPGRENKKMVNVTVIKNKRKALKNAFCWMHEGKMFNIPSVSTNPLTNSRCIENCKKAGWICQHCYSIRLMKIRPALAAKLERNRDILTLCELTREDVENIIDPGKYPAARLEAFGDLENMLQVKNYFTIAKYNKKVVFALWTKSPDIIEKAVKKYNLKKPGNLNIIYSYPCMNAAGMPIYKKVKARFNFVNKIFVVHDAASIKANKTKINCLKSCYECRKCYTKNKVKVINEKLK